LIPARTLVSGLALVTLLVAGCGQSPLGARLAGGVAAKQALSSRLQTRGVPASYYAPVAGMTGQALLQGLKQIVARHKDLGYDGARDAMFATVDDLDNDNVVECIYIGRTLANVTNRSTAYHGGSGMNAEHTWPQSKGAVGAAKADLNHLFPADCHANSTRGNYPFGEVAREAWTDGGSTLGTNAQGQTVFEPRPEQKGNTARALLYFYTVYGQLGSTSLENFKIEEPVLKKWHQEDPVTDEDRARNDAVQAAQGNRNPYVDHPEFVAQVGTFLAGGGRR
jgi:endonuclease I